MNVAMEMEEKLGFWKKINQSFARGILGVVYGFRIGILAAAVILLFAWAWSPKALIFGAAIIIATIFIGLVSGLATGTSRGWKTVVRAIIGALIASPAIIAVTTKGIPKLFQPWIFTPEHQRLVLILLKHISPLHFVYAILVGLIVGIFLARMEEDVYFVVSLRR